MNGNETSTPEAAFSDAIGLINAGRLNAAAAECRGALERDPNNVNMTALLGAILLKAREVEDAERYLRRAIALAPSFAKPQEDLGVLLLERGRPEEAIPFLEAAIRLDPGAEFAVFTRGRALSMLGRGEDADAAFEASFDLNPERGKLARAVEQQRKGHRTDAMRAYREILATSPRNVDAMRFLAGLYVEEGKKEESEALLRQAVSLSPDYTLAWLDLGVLYQEQFRYAEAIECLERAVALEPKHPRPRYLLAATLAPAGRTDAAMQAYREVLACKPEHAGARLGLAHTLKTLGRQQEAVAAYRECIRLRPDNGEPWWSLANLKTYRLTAADVCAMQSALDREGELTAQSAVNFRFALAKTAEDDGDFAAAWGHYSKGNAKQRAIEYYDPVQTETINDEIIEVFDRALLERTAGRGHPDGAPIFIVGLPRSGSTLIEQILASHSAVEGTSELPYLGRVATSLNRNRVDGINYPHAVRELGPRQLKSLGQDYLDRAAVHRQSDRPRFIDKMPNNFPSIGLLHLILPNATIIDARRYPLDAALSCYRQLFARGQTFVYDLIDIGEYWLEYQRLMDHWHAVLPGRILTVKYEDLVTDFDVHARRILEHCALPWEDACARFYDTDRPVRTASSEQVRRPIYTSSVHFWRNYETELGELIEILQPVLPRYARYERLNPAVTRVSC